MAAYNIQGAKAESGCNDNANRNSGVEQSTKDNPQAPSMKTPARSHTTIKRPHHTHTLRDRFARPSRLKRHSTASFATAVAGEEDALDQEIARPIYRWLRRLYPRKTIRRLARAFALAGNLPQELDNPLALKNRNSSITTRCEMDDQGQDTSEVRLSKEYEAGQQEHKVDDLGHTAMGLGTASLFAPVFESDRQSIASTTSGNEPNQYQRTVDLYHDNGIASCYSVQSALFDTQSEPNVISQQGLNKIGHVQRHQIPLDQRKSYTSPLSNSIAIITPTEFIYVKLHSNQFGLHDDKVKLKIMEEASGFDIILGRRFIRKHSKTGSLLARVEGTPHDNIESEVTDSQVQRICALREVKATKEQNETDAAHRKEMEALRSRVQNTSQSRAGSVVSGDAGTDAKRHWRTTVPQLPHAYYEDKTPIQLQANQSPGCPAEWQSVKTSTWSSVSSVFSCGRQSTVSSASSWGVGIEMQAPKPGRQSKGSVHGVVGGRVAEDAKTS
ncbi:hypothetical protein DL98DRAFT_532460 [Cadophora sp. DSE1049]|nr:hypothetical protein DL98DRAFT_532460 [Cadophora sp. DSE1049]